MSASHHSLKALSRVCISPVVPVLHLEGVKLRNVHVLGLPGRLVVRQLSPLDQVVDVVLSVHTEKHSIIYSLINLRYSKSQQKLVNVTKKLLKLNQRSN